MAARIRYGCTVDTGKLSEEDRADIAEIETASSDQRTRQVEAKQPAAAAERRPGDQARLIFASFLMLFVELALIRWVTANNVYVTKATNFVLIASFLGIGIGFLNARSQRDYLRWTPVALLALVGFVLAFPVILASLSGPHPLQGLGGTPVPWPSSSRCWSWSRCCRSSGGRRTTSWPTSRPPGSPRRSTCRRTTSPTRRRVRCRRCARRSRSTSTRTATSRAPR